MSVLVRALYGESRFLGLGDEDLSICNVKKRDVEPTTDDNDEPLTISTGLTKYKK
jgi:hypothetical protein